MTLNIMRTGKKMRKTKKRSNKNVVEVTEITMTATEAIMVMGTIAVNTAVEVMAEVIVNTIMSRDMGEVGTISLIIEMIIGSTGQEEGEEIVKEEDITNLLDIKKTELE